MDVFFIDPQSYNGLEVYDKSLLDNIDAGLEVRFLCSSLFKSETLGRGGKIPIIRIFSYNTKQGVSKIISYLHSLLRVKREIKKYKPHVLHIQWIKIPFLDLLFYKYIKNRFKVKIVFTAHNVVPHESNEREQRLYGNFYSIVDSFIVHEEKSKSELKERFGISENRIHVIRHGVLDLPTDPDLVKKEYEDIIGRYHIDNDAIVFASLGLQSYYKGTDVLMTVWKKNAQSFKEKSCHLVLAGSFNGLSADILEGCDNVCVENSYVSNERLQAFLKRANVVLLPYRAISQSGLLLTAIANKAPFLVTDVGGISEPLTIANVGWQIPYCDEVLLYNAMMELASNREMVINKKYHNDTSWETVQDAYSWETIANKTSELYKSLSRQI